MIQHKSCYNAPSGNKPKTLKSPLNQGFFKTQSDSDNTSIYGEEDEPIEDDQFAKEKELSSMVNIESILYKATPGDIESAFSYQKNVCEARVRAYATNVLGLKKFRYGLDDVSVSESSMYDYGCETEEPFIVTVDYKYYIK